MLELGAGKAFELLAEIKVMINEPRGIRRSLVLGLHLTSLNFVVMDVMRNSQIKSSISSVSPISCSHTESSKAIFVSELLLGVLIAKVFLQRDGYGIVDLAFET